MKNYKSNKEIIDYLKPYTEMDGITLKGKVVIEKVRGLVMDIMVIHIDIKSSWIGIGGTDTRHQTIKQHLTKNGFWYNGMNMCYIRPYHKKNWQ